jgi:uncharacterized OB-fold protein/acyl dehydratase
VSQSTDTAPAATFIAALREKFEGAELGPEQHGRFPVNEVMIAQWCDAMDDQNPVYTDPGLAAGSVHGGIVAPPAMLQAWIMNGLAPRPQDKVAEIKAALAEAGFTSVVATNCEQEYVRYLRPGDSVVARGVVESISEEKRTGLGDGHFVTTRTTLYDQQGETVGTHLFRVICFRPRPKAATTPAPAPQPAAKPAEEKTAEPPPAAEYPFMRPAVNEDTEFFWEGTAREEVLIQRCTACQTLRHPPLPMCPSCQSLGWDTVRAAGTGTLHSYVVMHHPLPKGVTEPYVVALADLDEGVRLLANLEGVATDQVRIGMPLTVGFAKVDDDLTVPRFRPAKA